MIDRPKGRLQDPVNGRFAKGNPGGAPRRMLTSDRHRQIVKHVRNGNYLSVAARAAGVGGGTLRRWLKRGEEDHGAGRDSTFARLFRDCRRAVAECEVELVGKIKAAGTDGAEQRRVTKKTMRVLDDNGDPKVMRDHKGDPVILDGRPVYLETSVTYSEVTRLPFDWRASARLLESRAQSRFGVKRQLQVGGGVHHRYTIEMSPEDEEIATRIATRRLGDIAVDGRPPLGPARQLPAGGDGAPK